MQASQTSLDDSVGIAPIHPETLLESILSTLEDSSAADIVTIPLEGKSGIADYMVVCEGRSVRQVASIADRLIRALKELGLGRVRVEGLPQADWVLVDACDVIVHVFRPEVREFYNLEKMWAADLTDAPVTH